MEITRTLVAGAMGLALVVGGVGCGQAAEKAAEKAAEQAIEQNGDCEDIDISSDGGVSGSCNGTEFAANGETGEVDVETDGGDVGIGSGADLPEGWPADLEVVDGLEVFISLSDELGLNFTGHLGEDADIEAVADEIRADLEAAGFTIEDDVTGDEGDGRMQTSITAPGEEFTARIAVTETPNDPQGALTVAYFLEPIAG